MGNVACCTSAPTEPGWKDQNTDAVVKSDDSCLKAHKPATKCCDLPSAATDIPAAAPEPVPTELILNLLDPDNGPAAGLPWQPHFLGPPQPPCEEKRLATIRALATVDSPPDPEIESILKTVASIFKSPAALVAKFEDKRVFISDSEGTFPVGDFPWRWTLCAWSLAYKNPQVLVIPDTMQDARFRHNEKVVSGPRVRFYCGAPLVAANGHRLGTLCFVDTKPREFDAASAFILNNFAELVVRRLEKDIAINIADKKNNELAEVYGGLQRAIDTVDTCVMMVDTRADGWNIVYTNASFNNTTGLERSALNDVPMHDVLRCPKAAGHFPLASHVAAVAKCGSFAMDHVHFRGRSNKKSFTLHWRPAHRAMDDAMMAVGVPSFLRARAMDGEEGTVSPGRYYFVTVESSKEARGHSVTNSLNSLVADSVSLDGLEMAHLLGKGSFGSVYAGTWWKAPVAVKIVEQEVKPLCPGSVSLEAILGAELRHPHIVTTLHYTTRKVLCSSTASVNDSAMDGNGHHSRSSLASCDTADFAASSGASKRVWAVIGAVPEGLSDDGEEGEDDEQAGDGAAAAVSPAGKNADPAADEQAAAEDERAANESAVHGEGGSKSGVSCDANASPATLSAHVSTDGGLSPGASGWSYTKAGRVNAVAAHGSGGGGSTAVSVVGSKQSAGASSTALSSVSTQTMIILEFCDKGCLQEAIDRGWLRNSRSVLHGGVNMEAVLATAREIASALAFLHSRGIVHGDLSAWNVMLTSSNSSMGSRGFVAKVADFGLARNLHDTSRLMTNTYGTLTHMPPETLTEGVISRAMDVYSFGVLLWQMYTGSRPWAGMRFPQIVMLVGQQHKQLQFLPDTQPAGFVKLAHDCMAADPKERPTFDEVLERLRELQDGLLVEPM